MLVDAATADRAAFARPFDVCIAGAGPAGITLARSLAARGYDVALMEAGEIDYSDASQAFYVGDLTGLPEYPCEESRIRAFGGTSGHWEGKCRAFEDDDFAARPWMPSSGWPIGRADLDPYAAEASAIVDLESPVDLPDVPMRQEDARFRHVRWRMSPPTRFGDKFRDEITDSGRITLGVRASLVDLRLADGLESVSTAVFRAWGGLEPSFEVTARAFVLCLGGLENARALLSFDSQLPAGIGNQNDLVGRYFCDRPAVATANLLLAQPAEDEAQYFTPTATFSAQNQLARCAVTIEPRRVAPITNEVKLLARTAGCLTPEVAHLVARLRGGKSPCVFGGLAEFGIHQDPENHPVAVVGVSMEQQLNRDSRVRLCERRDSFGMRRVLLDWQLTDGDYHTMRAVTLAFGAHVAEQGIGRLKLRDWIAEDAPSLPAIGTGNGMIAGRQHMCTTRMSVDARAGVVDPDCKVHGMTNLYISGSSVFPTPGLPKPTLTIVQLALRLGDHLSTQLS
ncbi:MAG: GMC oxidoreductase [Amaricoccus sp.]|uniref:GMC oxidoreductase n=1 Tax=Amaricoccus sp. TaxID=1872485 RepID=UPI0039E40FF4